MWLYVKLRGAILFWAEHLHFWADCIYFSEQSTFTFLRGAFTFLRGAFTFPRGAFTFLRGAFTFQGDAWGILRGAYTINSFHKFGICRHCLTLIVIYNFINVFRLDSQSHNLRETNLCPLGWIMSNGSCPLSCVWMWWLLYLKGSDCDYFLQDVYIAADKRFN